jgi:hypothetical protein
LLLLLSARQELGYFWNHKPRMKLLVRNCGIRRESIISFFFFFFSGDGEREWDNQNLVLEQTKETTNFIPYLNRSY